MANVANKIEFKRPDVYFKHPEEYFNLIKAYTLL